MEIDAKARKAQVPGQFTALQAALAVVEHLRVIGQFAGHAVHHLVDLHRLLEEQAEVEELHLEAQLVVGPQRMVVAVADGLILVPVQRRHPGRQLVGHGLVGLLRHLAGAALEPGVVEGLGLAQGLEAGRGVAGGSGPGQIDAGQGQRGGCLEQVTTMHGAPFLKRNGAQWRKPDAAARC